MVVAFVGRLIVRRIVELLKSFAGTSEQSFGLFQAFFVVCFFQLGDAVFERLALFFELLDPRVDLAVALSIGNVSAGPETLRAEPTVASFKAAEDVRIVAEEDRRNHNHMPAFVEGPDDVFVLTPEMRVDGDNVERENALATEAAEAVTPSIDEAAVADIARIVLREELNGPLGVAMTQNIKKMIRDEVQRALANRD